MAHGDWSKWCKNDVGISRNQATKFITVADQLDANDSTWNQIGTQALYLIATMPAEEREVEHTTANGTTKTPDEMTVKELREVKKALKEAQSERERLEQEIEKEPEVRIETPDDYEELRKENEELRRVYGDQAIYDDNTDAITYNVFEFAEDARGFIEKYGHLTHFPKEFERMISEGKEKFRESINDMQQFLAQIERSMDDEEVIIEMGQAETPGSNESAPKQSLSPGQEAVLDDLTGLLNAGHADGLSVKEIEKETGRSKRTLQMHLKPLYENGVLEDYGIKRKNKPGIGYVYLKAS